jgi:hypothetical protein
MFPPEAGRLFEAKELSEKPLFLGDFPWVVEREGKAPSETKASSFLLLEKACLSADREFPGGRRLPFGPYV